MNTTDYLLRADAAIGSPADAATALLTQDQHISYAQLRRATAALLHALREQAVQPTDRVAILGANSLFWVASYLAILKLGAVAVPLATVATPEDWQRQLAHVACTAVCAERRHKAKLQTDLPLLDESATHNSDAGSLDWPEPDPTFDLDTDAAILFTSGTTARPRGVRITHRNIQANTQSIIADLALARDSRMLVVLPFFYCFGLSLLHSHLRVGGSLALCNSFTFPETALDMLEKTHCTSLAGVPTTFQTLLRNSTFASRSFKTLRHIQQAGGKLTPTLIDELIAAAPNAELHVMYGQTEATARLSSLPPALLQAKRGSIGKGISGVQLQVVDANGQDVNPGETGEIIARGENISPGYYNDPEATAQKFVDGALHTGDVGTVDEDGFIYIVDRTADFIKSYGHRVSSQQIEACVMELADVVGAAAIGMPDELRGEAIAVFITLRNGAALPTERVMTHCMQQLPRHMWPKDVFVLATLPMNANGKVVKAELKKLCAASPVAST